MSDDNVRWRWLCDKCGANNAHDLPTCLGHARATGGWENCDGKRPPLQSGEQVYIVFDGPPSPESACFVDVVTPDGKSVTSGEWARDPEDDRYWRLGPFRTVEE